MQVRLPSPKGSKLGAIAGFVATTGIEKRSTALSGLVMWIFAPGLSGGAEEILRNLTRPSHRCRSVMSVRYADHNWKAVGTPVAPDGGRSQCQLDAFGRHDACCTEHRCYVRPSGRLVGGCLCAADAKSRTVCAAHCRAGRGCSGPRSGSVLPVEGLGPMEAEGVLEAA